MKILMFSHHSDVLHYKYRAFTELGHEVYIASEELTYAFGFKYSSVKNNKFEVVDQLFDPQVLYPDMKNVKFMSIDNISVDSMNLYWSMLPEITSLSKHSRNTWFDGQMQVYLRDKRFANLPGIKSANHPNAWELNKFHFVPNWVDHQPPSIDRTYITQLITECDKVSTTKELIRLKDKGLPVKIYGGPKCPDGFIRDINILPHTALLVHDKQFGVNCYAVCKALDTGIPVYMSKVTKEMIGFGDLPDSCFFFSEEWTIEEAYTACRHIHHNSIQNAYRSIYTLERTKNAIKNIIP